MRKLCLNSVLSQLALLSCIALAPEGYSQSHGSVKSSSSEAFRAQKESVANIAGAFELKAAKLAASMKKGADNRRYCEGIDSGPDRDKHCQEKQEAFECLARSSKHLFGPSISMPHSSAIEAAELQKAVNAILDGMRRDATYSD